MSELYKQIVWFMNSLAMAGKTTEEIADIVVINFPMAWICELSEGYRQGFTTVLGDTALVSLDIINKSIQIKDN